MQAVPTVEFGVLQRVDDVETPAPGRHQQGEDERFDDHVPVEDDVPGRGDKSPDGGDAERKPQHEVRQRREALAIAVNEDDGQRHGRQDGRKAVDRRGGGHEQQGIDGHEPQRMPRRDFACGYFAPGRTRVLGVDAAVGPAVETHGGIAGEDHAQDDLHEDDVRPAGIVQRGVTEPVDEAHHGKGHGEDRMGELNERSVFQNGIHVRKRYLRPQR